ncbi:MAG: hypothetical protein JO138_13955 [Acidobacteriaceae bacterium]|nr:hypothetical protein [Acidobacteriaceae bacterium]
MKKCFIGAFLYLATTICIFTVRPAAADGPYTFTIYVEKGETGLTGTFSNGHVFLGISDGVHAEQKWGWYTQGETKIQKLPGIFACAGGKLKSDDGTPYDVSKTYPITRHGYYVVQSQVIRQRSAGESGTATWHPFNHCGDFVQDTANAAGLHIELPWHLTGRNRPNIFADYLLAHGGIAHSRTPSAANWSGVYTKDTTKVRVNAQGGQFTASSEWTQPGESHGAHGAEDAWNCRLRDALHAHCEGKGRYWGPEKALMYQGTVDLTLEGKTISWVEHIVSVSCTSRQQNCNNLGYTPAIHVGAVFSGSATRE